MSANREIAIASIILDPYVSKIKIFSMSSKVFISHSSKTPDNKEVLETICNYLTDSNFSVLVDRNIKAGTPWFERLYDFMYDCNAAVILLSDAALNDSDWVKAEAAILGARKRRNESFELLLVPLDGIKPEHIAEHAFFKVIRLADFNMIRGYQDRDDLNAQLHDKLKVLQESETPFEKMAVLISDILAPIQKHTPGAIERAIDKIKPADFIPLSDNPADSLARLLLRDSQSIFKHVKKLCIELSHLLDKNDALRVLDIIKGNWVHPEAAYLLIKAHDEKRAVTINSSKISDFTGDCYAKKAWPSPSPYKIVSLNPGDRTIDKIETTLLNEFAKSARDEESKIRRLAKFNDPFFLVFPFPESNNPNEFPDKSLLDKIKEKLKNVTVIIATGHNLPSHLNDITTITPLLDATLEDDRYDDYTDAIDYVDEYLRG